MDEWPYGYGGMFGCIVGEIRGWMDGCINKVMDGWCMD
jgi:hypothetical protein